MANNDQIVQRWADVALGKEDHNYSRQRNVYAEGDSLYSYGHHFEVARAIRDSRGKVRMFLLNGDIWPSAGWHAGSTSHHQAITRETVKETGVQSITLPFSALDSAGIIYSSIKPIEVLDETFETTVHTATDLAGVPQYYWPKPAGAGSVTDQNAQFSRYTKDGNAAALLQDDGTWQWKTYRHWLGSAVFTAQYTYERKATKRELAHDSYPYKHVTGTAYFLSAFDENEPRPLYFLAQLPKGAKPASYAEAIEALKPDMVKEAESAGSHVLRQGDVFARASTLTTRDVHEIAPSKRGAYVLGVNHTVTESVTAATGDTFARGVLRHAPREWGRAPEHRRVKLGDGKTWYRLARNTVPDGRSWSLAGRVD